MKLLRLALPVGAALFVVYYGAIIGTSWKLGAGKLSVGEVQLSPDDLTMKNPSYFGVTKDGSHYEVRAKRAVVEFSQQKPIGLFGIDGELVQPNKVVTRLRSKRGSLDNAKSELELWDNVEIDATNGLTVRLSRATVYQKESRVVSKAPVKATMPTGTVEGASMAMKTNTHQATFFGDVKVHLNETAAGQGGVAMGRDSRAPVDVTSEQLNIDDTAKTAYFTGRVVATQGETTLRTPDLLISYEGKAADQMMASGPPQAGQGSRLSRLVAMNGAIVTAGSDRRITSTQADFDAKADTALFSGNVVVTQMKNVLQGQRLFVERASGKTRLESPGGAGQPAGRITASFYQADTRSPQVKIKSAAAGAVENTAAGVLGSFRTDPNAPINVEADTLDVFDTQKQAVFHGNVKSQQGDFVVRTVELIAHYSGQAGFGLAGNAAAEAASKGPAQLTRIDAKQKVLVTSSKDGQTATGDWAIFDVKANTVVMGDRVIVTRGKDVAEGPRLKIDLNTGMYRFELENEQRAVPIPANTPPPGTAPPPALVPGLPGGAPGTGRECPPGKQCLLFFPRDAQERAKEVGKKLLPGGGAPASNGSEPGTGVSSSPVQRGN